jgi:hypothetical protein
LVQICPQCPQRQRLLRHTRSPVSIADDGSTSIQRSINV